MKARSILIISGAVVLALIIGLVIYLAASRPEALLTNVFNGSNLNNNEPISGENGNNQSVVEGEVNELGIPSVVKEEVGWCLFLSEKKCGLLSVAYEISGKRRAGLVGNLPEKVVVYAPFDGYIHRIWSGSGNEKASVIKITTDPKWSLEKNNGADASGYYSFSFAAESVDLLINGQVKKGDPIFRISSSDTVWKQYLKGNNNLYIYLGGPWGEITNPSENPKEYLGQIMEVMK